MKSSQDRKKKKKKKRNDQKEGKTNKRCLRVLPVSLSLDTPLPDAIQLILVKMNCVYHKQLYRLNE